METVLITGGTGTIGKRLCEMLLEKGFHVIVLTRKIPEAKNKNISYSVWNVDAGIIDNNAIANADYIIHLAGAGVAEKRWTAKRKKEIQESRTKSSALIVKALQENKNKVKAVISSSAIGWYGEDKIGYGIDKSGNIKNAFTETDAADLQFLGETCRLWEQSIEPVTALGKRLVILRTGIVLSKNGGAFTEFEKPLKFGFATILGSGKQVISWIHEEDICRMYLFALQNENVSGVYNAVAPKPVDNKTLMLSIAKIKRGKFFISMHVPSFVLKLILGEMSVEVLKSATVSCSKIQAKSFSFFYPSIDGALQELCKK